MLYDKRWERKAEQPSLEGLLAWLEAQPDRVYDYTDARDCLVARYLQHIGYSQRASGLHAHEIDTFFGREGHRIAVQRPWTYKAALHRARGNWLQRLARRVVSRTGF